MAHDYVRAGGPLLGRPFRRRDRYILSQRRDRGQRGDDPQRDHRDRACHDEVTDAYSYDAGADAVWGIGSDQTRIVTGGVFPDVSVEVDAYTSDNGQTFTGVAGVSNGSHETNPLEGRIAWDFMSQFSRGTGGSIQIAGGAFSIYSLG